MFLSEKWIRKFLDYNISFSISLDGAKPQTMRKIRPGTDLSKIVNSIALFSKLKEKEYPESSASIRILFLALNSNIHELVDLVTLAGRLNIDTIIVRQLINSLVHPLKIRKELLRYHKDLANRYFLSAKTRAEQLGIDLTVKLFETESTHKPTDKHTQKSAPFRYPQKCFVPWQRILVRVNGDVTPCCSSGEIMGNIHKDGFWNVWNGRKYRHFRSRINTNSPPLDCRNCVQSYGINQGNADNMKSRETPSQKSYYLFERQKKIFKYGYHYFKNYI
jgi:radical SAM protein with 4Fe4S-binding SPASM domain